MGISVSLFQHDHLNIATVRESQSQVEPYRVRVVGGRVEERFISLLTDVSDDRERERGTQPAATMIGGRTHRAHFGVVGRAHALAGHRDETSFNTVAEVGTELDRARAEGSRPRSFDELDHLANVLGAEPLELQLYLRHDEIVGDQLDARDRVLAQPPFRDLELRTEEHRTMTGSYQPPEVGPHLGRRLIGDPRERRDIPMEASGMAGPLGERCVGPSDRVPHNIVEDRRRDLRVRHGSSEYRYMTKTRLEAFSDAVIAIIMTIMVLELTIPHSAELSALRPLVPKLLVYLLSFVFLGIYWSNHHHLIHTVTRVNGKILWANLHLLFWLSLTPFVTGWMGENDFESVPAAAYGIVMLLSAVAYYILQSIILSAHHPESKIRAAFGRDVKGKISPVVYAAAIPLAFVNKWIALGLYVFVALMWLVPDRRIESILE